MQEQAKNKINYKILVVLLLLWTILAVGLFLGYNYWSQYVQERSKMQNKISDLGSKLDSTHDKIHKYLDQAPGEAPLTDSALLPVKTAFILTQLAQEKLQETKDPRLAQHLLRAAQANLALSNDPQLVHVKAMLVSDQEKLSAVKVADANEISSRVDTLESMVDTLPLKSASVAKQAHNKAEVQANANKLQKAISSVMNDAKSVVKVRQRSEVEAAMSQVGTEVQTAYLKILLSQIRWAAYYHDNTVYQRNIEKLMELISQLYVNNAEAQKFQQTLTDLAKIEVEPEVPNISDTVQALQAILVR